MGKTSRGRTFLAGAWALTTFALIWLLFMVAFRADGIWVVGALSLIGLFCVWGDEWKREMLILLGETD